MSHHRKMGWKALRVKRFPPVVAAVPLRKRADVAPASACSGELQLAVQTRGLKPTAAR
jgi:hypothetical protein